MITATFSLVQQLVSLHVMPPLRIIHTDSTSRGRIYVPIANFLLLVGTIGLSETPPLRMFGTSALTHFNGSAAVGFGTEAGLTNAYGFAVSGVMFITSTFHSARIGILCGTKLTLCMSSLHPRHCLYSSQTPPDLRRCDL